jgi:hypothetical protein
MFKFMSLFSCFRKIYFNIFTSQVIRAKLAFGKGVVPYKKKLIYIDADIPFSRYKFVVSSGANINITAENFSRVSRGRHAHKNTMRNELQTFNINQRIKEE